MVQGKPIQSRKITIFDGAEPFYISFYMKNKATIFLIVALLMYQYLTANEAVLVHNHKFHLMIY